MKKWECGKKVARCKREVAAGIETLTRTLSGETWNTNLSKDELISRAHENLIEWKNKLRFWQDKYTQITTKQ